jgi:spermidine synthase
MTTRKKRPKLFLLEEREYHSPSSGIFFKVKNLIYSGRSPYQKIEVIENEHFGRVLLLDGLVQTTERDEFFYHEMLVHPAFACHPSPQDILIVGGGDGGALKEILRYPIRHAQLVEIDRQVIDVCRKHFPWLSPSLEDKRVELVVADGKEFIARDGRKFDVVIIDSSDPVGPSVSLHGMNFYKKLKKRLHPGGIVVAQAGSPFYCPESIKKKRDFLRKIFKIVDFYLSPVPTYPGGSWCFVFLSDKVNPSRIKRKPAKGLKYFNLEVHHSAFSLPNYLKGLGTEI